MNPKRAKVLAITMLFLSATVAAAQIPPPTVTAPVPHPNPSSSLVLPAPGEVRVSPGTPASFGSGGAPGLWYGHRPFCGVFHRGPCFPHYLPPIGQDLRLTIVSIDDNDPSTKSGGDADKGSADANKGGGNVDAAPDNHRLDSIGEMFAALRACWVPPQKDEARHGMQYTIRFAFKSDGGVVAAPRMTYSSHDAPAAVRDVYRNAVDAALKRCIPLHLSKGMAGAIAGRPIAIRFVDNRTIENVKEPQ
jgi:hypothetical protein